MSRIVLVFLNVSESEHSISLGGQLLLASPALSDGTFDHSVILLSEHTSTAGAIGAIINHPTGTIVSSLIPELQDSSLAKLPVLQGGPLGTDQLNFSLITWNSENKLNYLPKISPEAAELSIYKPDCIVQATVGHSAWSPGQLEHELQLNTWITLKPSASLLWETHDVTLWKRLLSSISPYHALLSQAPTNPLLN